MLRSPPRVEAGLTESCASDTCQGVLADVAAVDLRLASATAGCQGAVKARASKASRHSPRARRSIQ
eukprot:3707950-Alexandrium_andersonii.AAC.1